MVLDLMYVELFYNQMVVEFRKNITIFGARICSSVHVDNKKKDILILGTGPADGLDDTTSTAEKKYSLNFTEQQKKFCLRLLYNEVNR